MTYLVFLLIAVLFAIDLAIPLGVAAGVTYALPVFLAVRFLSRRLVIVGAALCSLLTLIAFVVLPPTDDWSKALVNRILSIAVLWLVASMAWYRRAASGDSVYTGSSIPREVGPYTIVKELGRGGMGIVFRAVRRASGEQVALKAFVPDSNHSRASLQRFLREVEAAQHLDHPNIVRAFDAGTQADVHYLAMELVEGPNLRQLVMDRGPLPECRAVDYVRQATQGIAYAHGRGVIHRDIKPSNLVLHGDQTIKILDMGLARYDALVDGEQDWQSHLTQSGLLLGSIDFMAPEQAVDFKRADERADIYSLGCTLYFLLTGQSALVGSSAGEKLQRLFSTQQKRPAELPDGVAPDVRAVYAKMVHRKPDDRFQSAEKLLEALSGIA